MEKCHCKQYAAYCVTVTNIDCIEHEGKPKPSRSRIGRDRRQSRTHSPGGRDNDHALYVEDEDVDLPVADQFEEPGLVDAAHGQRYGEAEVADEGAPLDGDVLQHEHDHAREEGAVGEAVQEPYCLGCGREMIYYFMLYTRKRIL